MSRLMTVLTRIYVSIALITFLYAYPWIPNRLEMFAVAFGLAWAAGYLATTLPIFTGFVYGGSAILSALTLIAATRKPWLALITRDTILFTWLIGYTLFLTASTLSVKRRDVAGLATGALAAAALKLPEGVFIAIALLAIYASVSTNIRGSAIASILYSYIYSMGVVTLWVLGEPKCFSDLAVKGLSPVTPVAEAILNPLRGSAEVLIPQLYTIVAYSILVTVTNIFVFTIIASVASRIEARVSKMGYAMPAASKTILMSAPLLTLLGYFTTIDIELYASRLLGCKTLAIWEKALVIGGVGALLAFLYKLAGMLASLRSLEEEKQSILEVLKAYERELRRIKEELEKFKLMDDLVSSILSNVEKYIGLMKETVLKAGLLDLPIIERNLGILEEEYHRALRDIIEYLRRALEETVKTCNTIAEYAAQYNLLTDCSEAQEILAKLRRETDILNFIVFADKVRRHVIDYLEALLDEISMKAESIGLKIEETKEWVEATQSLKEVTMPNAERVRKASKQLLTAISALIGRIRAHEG